MISLNFDPNVLVAQRNINISSNYVNQALERLTSGFRINSPADDPILNRIKNLALQGSNDNVEDSERQAIQKETDALLEELFKLKDESEFNGINVFGADDTANAAVNKVSASSTPPPDSSNALYHCICA